MGNLNLGKDYGASEAHNYSTTDTYSDEAFKSDRYWLAEAKRIAAGETMMLPERKHLLAVVAECKRLEQKIANLKELGELKEGRKRWQNQL